MLSVSKEWLKVKLKESCSLCIMSVAVQGQSNLVCVGFNLHRVQLCVCTCTAFAVSHIWHISSSAYTEFILFLVDCSKKCNDPIQADWPFFQDFSRIFTWELRVSAITKSYQLEFPAPGMRQIQSLEQCPDKHTYSLLMYVRAGPVNLGTFCQNGAISRIQVPWRGRITLEVPGETTLSSYSFKYTEANGKEQQSTYSLALSDHFILVRVAVNPKSIPGTLRVSW